MTWPIAFTLAIVGLMVVGLIRYAHLADVIFVGALAILTLAGIVTPEQAVAGFKNEGVLTVGALYVVAAGLVETGVLAAVVQRLLGQANSPRRALRRLVPPLIFSSAFLNNTTVVAMSMPALLEWARRRGVAVSRMLIPISYAAILGGVCTLIGTSTNLVVHGLMRQSNLPALQTGIGMWEIGAAGLPIAIVGGIYLIYICPRLLPRRKEFLEQLGETRREYLADVLVGDSCPLIGRTIQDAGLRGLPGLFLVQIERGGDTISPVEPDERLCARDRLTFTGVVSTIVDIQRIPGIQPAADTAFAFDPQKRHGRRLCEAVISRTSPLIGLNIREANFRTTYDAAVIAVHRNGQRLRQKVGDIRLSPGDTLLLETGGSFVRAHRNNPHFYLVSDVGEAAPLRRQRAGMAVVIAGLLILALTLPECFTWAGNHAVGDWFAQQRVGFSLLAACLMVATRCLSIASARRSVDFSVLVTIAASLGVGAAISSSGVAALLAESGMRLTSALGPLGALAGIYVLTWLLTELMSNNAAAALVFPVAVATAQAFHANPRPFAITLAVAASAGFLLPAGYQTHLMVFGPGGYRVADFFRAGVPMVVIWFVLTMIVVPLVWPLAG